MHILKRALVQQITLKCEFTQNVYRMQRLQIQNIHHKNVQINLAKPVCMQFIALTTCHPHRSYSSQTESPQSASWLQRLFGRFTISKSALEGKSCLLYGKAIDDLNYAEFMTKFNLPNSFNTWFLITEIHVWMLMARAMGEKEHGQIIRNGIVAALWTDALTRSKEMASGSMRIIRKQIEELSEQFQYAIVLYDEGLTKDDKQLASALWVRYFNSNCDNYEHIELLVKYIRCNIAYLDKLSTDDFLTKRNITWTSLNDLDKS